MTDEQMLIEAERSALVKAAVEKILTEGGTLNHRTVQSRLPKDFLYDRRADDFMRFVDQTMPDLPGAVATNSLPEPTHEPADARTLPEPEADGLPLDPYERGVVLREKLRELDQQTATARAVVYTLTKHVHRARAAMAREIQAMNSKIRPLTAEDNARQFIASSSGRETGEGGWLRHRRREPGAPWAVCDRP